MHGIYDLLSEVQGPGKEYTEKMIHPIPPAKVVNRLEFLVGISRDKRILDCGCAQNITHAELKKVAKEAYGIDLNPVEGNNYMQADLDQLTNGVDLPDWEIDLVICGELIEHLTNPGYFLRYLKKYKVPIVLTVPNCFSKGAYHSVRVGTEVVNKDHVAWYSWKTLSTLIEKCGYKTVRWLWYNGEPNTAEGLIFIIEAKNGGSEKKPA